MVPGGRAKEKQPLALEASLTLLLEVGGGLPTAWACRGEVWHFPKLCGHSWGAPAHSPLPTDSFWVQSVSPQSKWGVGAQVYNRASSFLKGSFREERALGVRLEKEKGKDA